MLCLNLQVYRRSFLVRPLTFTVLFFQLNSNLYTCQALYNLGAAKEYWAYNGGIFNEASVYLSSENDANPLHVFSRASFRGEV